MTSQCHNDLNIVEFLFERSCKRISVVLTPAKYDCVSDIFYKIRNVLTDILVTLTQIMYIKITVHMV